MSTVALRAAELVELDTDSSFIESAAKQVRRAILHSHVISMTVVTCYYLGRSQRVVDSLRAKLSEAEVKSPEDRAFMKDIGTNLAQAARALSAAYEQSQKRGVSRIPIFGERMINHLDLLSCTLEDMSETAALSASVEFSQLVRKEVGIGLGAHQRSHAAIA